MEGDGQTIRRILHAARLVYTTLGPGFIESIYTRALVAQLMEDGFQVDREKSVKIWYGSRLVGKHRLDLLVDGSVIIELKAVRSLIPVHTAQTTSYLRATSFEFGLLLNFGSTELQWELVGKNEHGSSTPNAM
jgi:GxxExxY protein